MYTLENIVIWIGTGVILISFIMALFIRRYKHIPYYMKSFYVYPLIALLISINTILFRYFNLYPAYALYFLQKNLLIIDFIFFGLFSNYLLRYNRYKNFIKIIFAIFAIATIYFTYSYDIDKPVYRAHVAVNLGKCLFCLFYFNSLFNDKDVLQLKKEPSFWIVTGVFFYSSITLPAYAIYDYLRANLSKFLSDGIFAATNMAIIIMHILFIQSYMCSARYKKPTEITNV